MTGCSICCSLFLTVAAFMVCSKVNVDIYAVVTRVKRKREDKRMLVCDYIVKQIDGDYAHLQRTDQPDEELKVVARALLPAEIYEGCELHYELMQYSMK